MQAVSKAPIVVADESNVSCRVPLLVIFLSAAVWLVVGSVFALIGSIKFHQPNFLAGCACLTYGRVYPAYVNCMLYGFCVPAGMGLALWLFARLGRVSLAQPWMIIVGAMLWNLGVTLGVVGILEGDSTGFVTLEIPSYGALLLFLGYLLLGLAGLLTLHQRRERQLFVSQWFLLAAIFWFPWIYSTATLLLVTYPVRGMTQAVIAWWYAGNFLYVWMALVGLAAGFYFIPKLVHAELHNHYLALFTFWTLILFVSWAGVPGSAPVPAWIIAISTIAVALSILPLISVALNIHQTLQGNYARLAGNPTLLFSAFAVGAYLVAGAMRIFARFFDISQQLQFSWFETAQFYLTFYGFFTMSMFGGIYYLLPRVLGAEFPSPKLVRVHFWVAAAGVLLLVVPFAVGGVRQAVSMQNPTTPFIDIATSTLAVLRASTVGDLLLLVGHLLFIGNSIALAVRVYRLRAAAVYSEATADLFKAAEVKS